VNINAYANQYRAILDRAAKHVNRPVLMDFAC
jgi:hypothetical protein